MISEETINKIAQLARLELTPQETRLYSKQLGAILDYVSELSKVKTEGVEPLVTPSDMPYSFREDVVLAGAGAGAVISNAPDKAGNLFRVPPVL